MSVGSLAPWIADALVLLGVAVMTVGVYGVLRMPDLFTRLHAASKAVVLGVVSVAIASIVTGEAEIIYRVLLISAVLLLTTPVAAHVIGRAAYLEGERIAGEEPVDETGRQVVKGSAKSSP